MKRAELVIRQTGPPWRRSTLFSARERSSFLMPTLARSTHTDSRTGGGSCFPSLPIIPVLRARLVSTQRSSLASPLTAGLAVGQVAGDAVGDANIFTTSDPRWFRSIAGTNANSVTGNVEAYVRTRQGGLALYSGEDFWATGGRLNTPHLRQVFDNLLNQQWDPDRLPSTTPAAGASTVTRTRLSGGGRIGRQIRVMEGTGVTDVALLTGVNAASARGSVSYAVYTDPQCRHLRVRAGTSPVVGGHAARSAAERLRRGVYYWVATYSGDSASLNARSVSSCRSEILTVRAPAVSLTITVRPRRGPNRVATLSCLGAVTHKTGF